MDIAQYEGNVLNITVELSKVSDISRGRAIEKYKRIAEKGAMSCPFCGGKLSLRAGSIREIHFAHLKGKTCQDADAYDTYQTQSRRENVKHSVIKEAIYTELKSQEVIKSNLKVEYGFKEKATERWRHYPDIYIKKGEREFAISVITNVLKSGDEKLVREINRRNKYFLEKGLETIWFVEDRELADDFDKRVMHLWEAEYGLAIKTAADRTWEIFLKDLIKDISNFNIFDLLGYRSHAPMKLDVRSLYYVHSTDDEIMFSVYRMILDEKRQPFRAFALTSGYRMHMSSALIIRDEFLLSNEEKEEQARIEFTNAVTKRLEQIRIEALAKEDTLLAEHVGSQIAAASAEALHEHDIDVLTYLERLKAATITEKEAKAFFRYLVRYRNDLIDYGLTFSEIKRLTRLMLGKINDAAIRYWLVEIEGLS
ncbi:competence protein CoiA family protein [Paenibacillus sp. MMS18-CY102]|uniref:competence protein CoiA family protein n=1 Tax=Paenibacillus sp. MMS18-CY102 TaxID=2682849 RepID=UPI0013665834|nr:competence protein CoiA family protein [Paenibacillus sp. MMS18-CY102]MWC31359.1 competence protein CoiA [Paenibacillus sp. MMS18-CY102]